MCSQFPFVENVARCRPCGGRLPIDPMRKLKPAVAELSDVGRPPGLASSVRLALRRLGSAGGFPRHGKVEWSGVEWSGFLGEKEGVARLKLSPEGGSAKMGNFRNMFKSRGSGGNFPYGNSCGTELDFLGFWGRFPKMLCQR
jgi:hypothetical protein